MLFHPDVDAAVLETARGGVLREGLAFDRCDVAVVTNCHSVWWSLATSPMRWPKCWSWHARL
ncbi:MAG: hypothetical protein IPH35_17410 [Rhodoferax sp.]|nr:hypothetical protein [Rhodoferax sp.]